MRWFGASWGAPICDSADHVKTPTHAECERCGGQIEEGDRGVELPFIGSQAPEGGLVSYHLNCFLREVGVLQ